MDRIEATIARIADLAQRGDVARLSAMLREDGAHFRRTSTAEAERIRGHVYAALARCATVEEALPQAREDLRTSDNPVVLAGIARLAIGSGTAAGWRADLEAAGRRIATADRYPGFVFDPPPTCCSPARTALEELREALACADRVGVSTQAVAAADIPDADIDAEAMIASEIAAGILLEDQDGARLHFDALIRERPCLMAFFYTRCMNPQKCSLTIARLGALLRHANDTGHAQDFAVCAISYDPDFDDRARLRNYGLDHGFPFGANARLLRCLTGRKALAAAFGLRVGYAGFTVNAHARELFLVDTDGRCIRLPPDCIADPDALAGGVLSALLTPAG
jgi:cytochrome oxidase Cu insertion factor (SCO1/SenC/PrrC family)